jgi:hypothetical protein
MKKIIHVNQHKIKANTKNGTDDPVLTVKTYKDNEYAHEAVIKTKDGSEIARLVYRPHKPLNCGARVWLEFDTDNVDVEVINRE